MSSRAFRTRTIPMVVCLIALAIACGGSDTPLAPPSLPATPPPMPTTPPPADTERPAARNTGPFEVVAVDLGKSINPDKSVAQATLVFAPGDTIYAAVASNGRASSVELKARWTYAGHQLVNETTQTIAPTGATSTEFHIAKPGGWPAGAYRIEIYANGDVAVTKDFSVQ